MLPILKMIKLFVIQRGEGQFWACSSEHGTGWHEGNPKQAFSPSELTKNIRLMIDEGWWNDCAIRALDFAFETPQNK